MKCRGRVGILKIRWFSMYVRLSSLMNGLLISGMDFLFWFL